MNYKDALELIIRTHHNFRGRFFKELPDLNSLPQPKAQAVLIERIQHMRSVADKDGVGFAEVTRFCEELDVMYLLLVVCVWGGVTEDVPITEADFYNLFSSMHNSTASGVGEEEGEGILDTVKRLVDEGLRLRQLPDTITILIPELVVAKRT